MRPGLVHYRTVLLMRGFALCIVGKHSRTCDMQVSCLAVQAVIDPELASHA